MKIKSRQLNIGNLLFEGDSAGGDELLLIPDPVPSGATAIISHGSDYGSWLSVYRITEKQYQSIISDNPPFSYSYEARDWLQSNGEADNGQTTDV